MNMHLLVSNGVAHRVGWCLVHFVWQGALVALVLAIALALLRTQSARLRYAVCFGALLLMAAMPVLTYGVQTASLAPEEVRADSPVVKVAPIAAPAQPARAVETPVQAHARYLVESSLPWLCWVWLCGVAAFALRNTVGWFRVRGLVRRDTRALGEPWRSRLDALCASLKIERQVRLLESARVTIPMAAGVVKPVVLLPASILTRLAPEQIEAILAHELAHIRRHDFLANVIQTVVETLLFYHPAVWWVSRRIREEREHCCDDVAVRVCGNNMAYARALASLAGLAMVPSGMAVAATSGLFRRVQRIVGAPEKRAFGAGPSFAAISAFAVVLGMALVPHFGCASGDLTAKVAKIDIDHATRDDLIAAFGNPVRYAWDGQTNLDPNHLPSSYCIDFPHGVNVYVPDGTILELRFSQPNYTFRGKIRVGSTLDDVLATIGQPDQTVVGQPLGFYDKVLYKDIDGKQGYCYYAREDCSVRLWFNNYEVSAVYVTRSDYTDGAHSPRLPGAPIKDLTPVVESIAIDTATQEDVIRAFGTPRKFSMGQRRLDPNNLPDSYTISFPDDVDVWMVNGRVRSMGFCSPNYTFRGTIRVGSTLDEVIAALGQPSEVVTGQPTQTPEGQVVKRKSGVLYRDLNGRKGTAFYRRDDAHILMNFEDDKVWRLAVMRIDYVAP